MLLTGFFKSLLSLNRELGDFFPEPVVGNHADHVRDTVFFQKKIERRDGEAGVGAQQDVSPRVSLLQLFDEPLQERDGGF